MLASLLRNNFKYTLKDVVCTYYKVSTSSRIILKAYTVQELYKRTCSIHRSFISLPSSRHVLYTFYPPINTVISTLHYRLNITPSLIIFLRIMKYKHVSSHLLNETKTMIYRLFYNSYFFFSV